MNGKQKEIDENLECIKKEIIYYSNIIIAIYSFKKDFSIPMRYLDSQMIDAEKLIRKIKYFGWVFGFLGVPLILFILAVNFMSASDPSKKLTAFELIVVFIVFFLPMTGFFTAIITSDVVEFLADIFVKNPFEYKLNQIYREHFEDCLGKYENSVSNVLREILKYDYCENYCNMARDIVRSDKSISDIDTSISGKYSHKYNCQFKSNFIKKQKDKYFEKVRELFNYLYYDEYFYLNKNVIKTRKISYLINNENINFDNISESKLSSKELNELGANKIYWNMLLESGEKRIKKDISSMIEWYPFLSVIENLSLRKEFIKMYKETYMPFFDFLYSTSNHIEPLNFFAISSINMISPIYFADFHKLFKDKKNK